MTPNIDRRGRIVRAISGVIFLAAGVLLWFLDWPHGTVLRWLLRIGLPLIGAVQLFEARRGWCAARACGVKTPL